MAFPRGKRFAVDPENGEVVVHGGYRTEPGVWALRGIRFRFKPARRGVTMTAMAPPGSVLRFQDFLPKPLDRGHRRRHGAADWTPTEVSRLSVTPSTVEHGLTFASANVLDLLGYRRYVTVPADGSVTWTLLARRLPLRSDQAAVAGWRASTIRRVPSS